MCMYMKRMMDCRKYRDVSKKICSMYLYFTTLSLLQYQNNKGHGLRRFLVLSSKERKVGVVNAGLFMLASTVAVAGLFAGISLLSCMRKDRLWRDKRDENSSILEGTRICPISTIAYMASWTNRIE